MEGSERRVLVNAGSKFAAITIGMLTAFVLTPFLIRSLGTSYYGLQALSNQAIQFISLAAMAVGLSYDRFGATYYARGEYDVMNSALSAGFVLSLLAAGLLALGTVLTAVFADTLFGLPSEVLFSARVVILLLGLASVFHIIIGAWKSAVFITQRFYLESASGIISTVGAALVVWVAFRVATPSIIVWVALAAGFRVGTDLFFVVPLALRGVPELRIGFRRIRSRLQFREIANFGWLNFLGGIGYLLYYSTDSIMISNLNELGVDDVAFYNVAQRWDPQIRLFVGAYLQALVPLMTSFAAVGDTGRLKQTLLRGIRGGLIVALYPCVVMAFLAEPFFREWLGAEFVATSVPVSRVILGALVLSVPGTVGYSALYACGKIGWAVAATLAGGLLNVGLSIFLVKVAHLGLLGIAAGSATALCAVYLVFIPAWVCRLLKLRVLDWLKQGWLGALFGAAPLALCCLVLRRCWDPASLTGVFVQFGVCGLVYAASVWGLALTGEDRDKAREACASLLHRGRDFLAHARGRREA